MSPAQQSTDNLTLADYFRPAWRRKWLILVLVIVVTGGTYYYYQHKPKQYTASTALYLAPTGASSLTQIQNNSQRDIADEARLLQSPAIAVAVAKQLGYNGDPESLLGQISVSPDANDDFITLGAQSTDPAYAAKIVNAFAQAFVAERTKANLADAKKALKTTNRQLARLPKGQAYAQTRSTLVATAQSLQTDVALPSSDAEQINPAQPATVPVGPRPKRNAIFAFGLALLLGLILAYALERVDRRIDDVGELEPLYDVQVLAAIPTSKQASRNGDYASQASDFREAFRTLRTILAYSTDGEGANGNGSHGVGHSSLLVTSAVPSEGKTTVVRNLAFACAEVGQSVVIVDCDLRRPGVARILSLPEAPGLSDVLEGEIDLDDALQTVHLNQVFEKSSSKNGHVPEPIEPKGPAIHVLTAGSTKPHIPALLAGGRLPAVLEALRRDHDMVIVDTPPVLPVSDALGIMGQVSGVLIVSRVGITTAEDAESAVRLISQVDGARLLGVIANCSKPRGAYAGYSYSYGT